ncbi:unnamed protein product [Haemonchus placei]|uniref:TMV resistance protein N-like n=1 Tax=Haemonchus placei TaxID=6290 RepID=A0A0N4WBR2_HAEPC|nr:unnamed protein product [Haemonchus placei]
MTKTIDPLQVACDGNLKQGCRLVMRYSISTCICHLIGFRYLSLVHWNGEKHREADSKKAEMACDLEDGEACWLLSTWYMGNKEKFRSASVNETKEHDRASLGSLERDMYKALEYGIKACEMDVFQSCVNVARFVHF